MREFLDRWQGVILAAIGVVATGWLAATGRLGLYIHPRYFVFTVVMAVVATAFVVAAFAVLAVGRRRATDAAGTLDAEDPAPLGADDEHDHEHGPTARSRSASVRRRAASLAGAAVVLAAGVALLVLPPATLSTATAENRELNSVAAVGDAPTELVGGDTSAFTVKDWALVLRQGPDPADFPGAVELTGFVLPSPDSDDVFYVTRFTVTCCAVDAQPVGVPVHLPGWQERFAADDWVAVEGRIAAAPADAAVPTVLVPETIEPTGEPETPYVH